MTDYKSAISALERAQKDEEPCADFGMFMYEHRDTLEKALRIAAAVSEPTLSMIFAMKYYLPHGTGNDQLEKAITAMIKAIDADKD